MARWENRPGQGVCAAIVDFSSENSNTAVTRHDFVLRFSDIFNPHLGLDLLSMKVSCAKIEGVDQKLERFYGVESTPTDKPFFVLGRRPLRAHTPLI